MTLRSAVITFSGSVQLLSTALAAGVTDVAVYAVDIQADAGNAAVFHVGSPTVSATDGIRIPVPDTSVPAPPYRIGDFGGRNLELKDVGIIGTAGQKARVLVFA